MKTSRNGAEAVLNAISGYYYRLFGSRRLRGYEAACIQAWKRSLDPHGSELVEAQLASCDFIERQVHDRLVCLRRLRSSNQERAEANAFPLLDDHALVARMLLQGPNGRAVAATVTLAKGLLFSLEFDQAPPLAQWARRPEVDFATEKCEMVLDPMQPSREGLGSMPRSPWLVDLARRWGARGIRSALDESERARIQATLGATLPSDYVALIEQCDGLWLGPIRIRGVSEVDTLPRASGTLFVLVEGLDGRRYGVVRGGGGLVLCYDPESDDLRTGGLTLREAVEAELHAAEPRASRKE